MEGRSCEDAAWVVKTDSQVELILGMGLFMMCNGSADEELAITCDDESEFCIITFCPGSDWSCLMTGTWIGCMSRGIPRKENVVKIELIIF